MFSQKLCHMDLENIVSHNYGVYILSDYLDIIYLLINHLFYVFSYIVIKNIIYHNISLLLGYSIFYFIILIIIKSLIIVDTFNNLIMYL